MRAIMQVDMQLSHSELLAALSNVRSWWPPLNQEYPDTVSERKTSLDQIVKDERGMVEKTFVCMLYNHRTRTWALVNLVGTTVEFRPRNHNSPRLRSACELLVDEIRKLPFQPEFVGDIVIREAQRGDLVYHGEILPQQKLRALAHDRKPETWIVTLSLLFFMVASCLATPPIEHVMTTHVGADWARYWIGFIGRAASSAAVTAAVTFITLVISWLDVRREKIRWVLVKHDQ